MIERFERFSYAIFEVSRCWHKIAAEEMEKYGLKGSHATYLTTLYRYSQGITAARAEGTGAGPGAVAVAFFKK